MWSRATRPRICFGASVGGMRRKYEYRRTLPQYQKDGRALFITFGTWRRWELPEVARDLALEAFVHAHGRKYNLHAAVVMPNHVHLVCTALADNDGPVFDSRDYAGDQERVRPPH